MAELEALVLALGETLLVVLIVVAATAVIAELALLASAMLTMMIVVVIVLSIQPLTPALVGVTSQFAFIVHALRRLMPLWQISLLWDEYPHDIHHALTMPLSRLSDRPPCGFEADCHGLFHCI